MGAAEGRRLDRGPAAGHYPELPGWGRGLGGRGAHGGKGTGRRKGCERPGEGKSGMRRESRERAGK